MKAIVNFISSKLPLLILLSAVITYFLPFHLDTPSWVPSMLLGIVIFFTGLSMKTSAIKDILSKKKEIFVVTLLKWTLTVGVSIVLAYLFFWHEPEISAGFILSGTVPSATAATLYTFLSGGNIVLVIAANFLDTIISPFVTVLALMNLPGDTIVITFFDLLKSFILIVILPLSAGIFIQYTQPKIIAYSRDLTRFGSSFSLILIVHIIVGNGKEAIGSRLDILVLLIILTLIQVMLPMILGYVIAKKIGMSEADSRAILFQVGLCNSALAAILAFEFIGSLGAMPPIINSIINLSLGAYIANYFVKKDGRENRVTQVS